MLETFRDYRRVNYQILPVLLEITGWQKGKCDDGSRDHSDVPGAKEGIQCLKAGKGKEWILSSEPPEGT